MSVSTDPAATLAQERQAAGALLECLLQEQQLLAAADIDGLTHSNARKAALVQKSASLAQQRHLALGTAGFSASEEGMRQWLSGAPQAAREAWEELMRLAGQAREANRTNGLLIHTHLARNRELLGALRGESAGGVYGPGGQQSVGAVSRRLVVG